MSIDPDDSLEKVRRTLLTQIGLGLAFVYSFGIIKKEASSMPAYQAYWAILATFLLAGLYLAMSLKVFYNMSKWVNDKILARYRPSALLIAATLLLDVIISSLPIAAGFQVFHFARLLWQ